MKVFAIAASCAVLSTADKPDYKAMWTQFKDQYHKEYDANGNEEEMRYKIFKSNVDIIETTNAKKLSYELGVNEFADLTWDEFASDHLGYKSGPRFGTLPKVPFPNITDVADAIDWVQKGAVTPVKNQARCGSCWAFSTTGSIEGGYFVSSGKLLSLSEEDLVQCDHNGDQGCRGGLMDNAFTWVSQNGICTESSYPYTSGTGVTGLCKKSCTPAVTLTGHTDVPSKNEDALKAAVSKQPVSVAIEADKSAFQLYKKGVLDNPACGTKLDHGVLIVGYGTDSGKDYWKVKNSWGATWGEQGYLRMVRNKNQCGIAQQPSYPTGVKAASGPSPGPSPPTPPTPPSPPSPGKTHYEKPPCQSDEVDASIQGVDGSICAPKCTNAACPTDTPAGTKDTPACCLQDSASGDKYCAMECAIGGCPPGAACKHPSGSLIGICVYPSSNTTATVKKLDFVPSQHEITV